MFKKYHIVIFNNRDGTFRNLRLRGWFGLLVFILVLGVLGSNVYLWRYYTKALTLERELAQSQDIVQNYDNELLLLAGRLKLFEEDLQRIQQFDAKLRVLMNIGKDDAAQEDLPPQTTDSLTKPEFLAQHRELYVRKMYSLVEELTEKAQMEEVDQQSLVYHMRENTEVILSTPSVWPARGYLTSSFGGRRGPFSGRIQGHKGIDIANRPGTQIIAPAQGVVTFSGFDGAYGLCIIIDHGNNITTRYAHLQRSLVQERQFVHRGDVIAAMGSSGRSTGPHLHYEVHVGGVPVNPMRYILN